MKHKHLSLALLFVVLVNATLLAQEPDNLTTYWWPWSTNCELLTVTNPGMFPCPKLHEGVWAVTYLSDPGADAVVLTLTYDKDGERLTTSQLATKYNGCANALFIVGKVTVKSIVVAPVKLAGPSRQVYTQVD